MNTAQLEMSLKSEVHHEAGGVGFPGVSPYLERRLRTLSEAKRDHDSALLELTAADSRMKPTA
jgi:hypothetical protein